MITKYQTEKCVPGNRWVIFHGEKILQNYWEIRTYEGDQIIGVHGEWRNVETINEAADEALRSMNHARR